VQFSEIARGRSKRGVFGIFKGQNDVLKLKGLECNKGKLSGLVKWAKMRKPKLWGPKCNFRKDWPMTTRSPVVDFGRSNRMDCTSNGWGTTFIKGVGQTRHEVAGFEEKVGRIWTLLANGFGGRIRLPQSRSEEGKQA